MSLKNILDWKDLNIESVDADIIETNIKRGDKIAIRITYDKGFSITESLKSMKKLLGEPVVQSNYIYWIWGPTDLFYSYLNLLIYLLEDSNLNQYCSKYSVSLINVLGNLWKRYRDKPKDYIKKPTKEIHFTNLKTFLFEFLKFYEDTYFQFTNQRLSRTQLTELPSFTRKQIFTTDKDLYMLDTYPELWKNVHSLWYLGTSLKLILQKEPIKIPKKVIRNIFEITKKIIESKDFQRLKNIFICVATPTRSLTIVQTLSSVPNDKKLKKTIFKDIKDSSIKKSYKYCFFNGEHLNINIENNNDIDYLKELLKVLQNIEKIYELFFKLNKRDAILAFILNQFDFSIDKNNKNSFNYPKDTIQNPISTLLKFLIQNQEYLINPHESISNREKYKKIREKFNNSNLKKNKNQQQFNIFFNSKLLPKLGLTLKINDIRQKMKKLKKYQRDILIRFINSTNLSLEPPIFIDYQGEYHIKNIDTPTKIKALFDFYTEDDILKKHEAFSNL